MKIFIISQMAILFLVFLEWLCLIDRLWWWAHNIPVAQFTEGSTTSATGCAETNITIESMKKAIDMIGNEPPPLEGISLVANKEFIDKFNKDLGLEPATEVKTTLYGMPVHINESASVPVLVNTSSIEPTPLKLPPLEPLKMSMLIYPEIKKES